MPALSPRGISAGDFQEALTDLLGKDAPNLSLAVIARLKGDWEEEHRHWQARDLSARRYVYLWADGVYLQARMESQALYAGAGRSLRSVRLCAGASVSGLRVSRQRTASSTAA